MNDAKSTEDFVRVRAAFDEQVRNPNSVHHRYRGRGISSDG